MRASPSLTFAAATMLLLPAPVQAATLTVLSETVQLTPIFLGLPGAETVNLQFRATGDLNLRLDKEPTESNISTRLHLSVGVVGFPQTVTNFGFTGLIGGSGTTVNFFPAGFGTGGPGSLLSQPLTIPAGLGTLYTGFATIELRDNPGLPGTVNTIFYREELTTSVPEPAPLPMPYVLAPAVALAGLLVAHHRRRTAQ